MRVVYSVDARLGASGIGWTAFNAVQGIHAARLLTRLFVSANAQSVIPKALIREWGSAGRAVKYVSARDKRGLAYYLENCAFDAWVTAQLLPGDLFHSWHGHSLWSARRAHARGMTVIIERASSHPAMAARLLREAHARWGVPFDLPMWNYDRLVREINQADYITVPSAFARESMVAEGVPASKLIEIPFGVDTQRFTPSRDATQHPFRVLFVGQVSVRKGVPVLLDAWKELGWHDAELWIAGGVTPDFDSIRARWNDFHGVTFLGHARDVLHLYQQSDVFVFPSIEEGSALVTYEALACGLPVVTTFNAGSVVRDGEEGVIVPAGAVDALCAALERLRADMALRARMGRSARTRAEQFTWQDYRQRLVQSYAQIRVNG